MSYRTRRKHDMPGQIWLVVYPHGKTRIYTNEGAARGEATRYSNWLRSKNSKAEHCIVLTAFTRWEETDYEFDPTTREKKLQRYAEQQEKWRREAAERQMKKLKEEFPDLVLE